ncbi:hypothetical protein BDB01DRAFT_802167 [Pilobolus umbonatus]|nr:hypothetical protein BDB01DRAFT_802167 [Pilobolus umbonatus]
MLLFVPMLTTLFQPILGEWIIVTLEPTLDKHPSFISMSDLFIQQDPRAKSSRLPCVFSSCDRKQFSSVLSDLFFY